MNTEDAWDLFNDTLDSDPMKLRNALFAIWRTTNVWIDDQVDVFDSAGEIVQRAAMRELS